MSLAYLNGMYIDSDAPAVPVDERGHQFGDGVYEVIRVYNGHPFMLEEHLDRMMNSAIAIRLPLEQDQAYFRQLIHEMIQKSALDNLDIYLQITRGIAPRKHLFPNSPVSISMTANPFRDTPADVRKKGASVFLHPDERWANCYIKSLNLLPNILAKQEAADRGCLEAVLVRDGFVTEGASTNVYIVKDGAIRTAPLSNHILAGITRIAVKQAAHDLRIPFIEESFTPEELKKAEEAFLSSTTLEVMPIVSVYEDTVIGDSKIGPISQKLAEGVRDLIQRNR